MLLLDGCAALRLSTVLDGCTLRAGPHTASRLQGWSSAAVRTVQLCVACNMPYLDMNYNLAPRAELANGAPKLGLGTGGDPRSGWSRSGTAAVAKSAVPHVNAPAVVPATVAASVLAFLCW